MIFLQSHGVSSGYATKIFKQYGNEAIEVVKENPYRLATDIFGIGFVTADKIAEKLGFAKESELRAEAGILYVLHELSDEGHVYYPYEPLIEKCNEILQIGREVIVKAFGTIALNKMIVIEDLNDNLESFQENNKAVYLAKFHLSETSIVRSAEKPRQCPRSVREHRCRKGSPMGSGKTLHHPGGKQVEAVNVLADPRSWCSLVSPVPGKTTIINSILKIFKALRSEHSSCCTNRESGKADERSHWL